MLRYSELQRAADSGQCDLSNAQYHPQRAVRRWAHPSSTDANTRRSHLRWRIASPGRGAPCCPPQPISVAGARYIGRRTRQKLSIPSPLPPHLDIVGLRPAIFNQKRCGPLSRGPYLFRSPLTFFRFFQPQAAADTQRQNDLSAPLATAAQVLCRQRFARSTSPNKKHIAAPL